jgi:hypothetical protein
MKHFKQFLNQLPNSTIVCSVGEFNPPTVSHELLVKTVKVVAEQKNCEHIIFTSNTDLLSEERKQHYLKLLFPKTTFVSLGEASLVKVINRLSEQYKNVIVISGSEQESQIKKLKESVNIQFISVADKEPDTSKIKQFATKGIYENFKKLLPSTVRDIDGKLLMNDVREKLGLEPVKEQVVFSRDELREKYFHGEIYNVGDIVESNGVNYEIVKRGSNHLLLKEESGELVSKWIQDVSLVKEGVIQPSGTDKIETNQPESDKSTEIGAKPKGKVKGFLTFYNYDDNKKNIREQIIGTQHTGSMHHTKTPATDKFHDKEAKAKMKAQMALKHAREKETLSHKHQKEKLALSSESLELKEGGFDNYHEIAKELVKRHGKNVDTSHINDLAGERDTHRGLDHSEVMHHVKKILGSKEVKEDLQNKTKKIKNYKDYSADKQNQDLSRSGNLNAVGGENTKSFTETHLEIPKDAPSVETIAAKHNVSVDEIKNQLEIGMKVEAEHGKNPGSEREIALDHLNEKPDYYKKLKRFVEHVNESRGHKIIATKLANIERAKKFASGELNIPTPQERRDAEKKKPNIVQDRPGISTETRPVSDPFFKEEFDLSDSEIDDMIEHVSEDEILSLFEDNEWGVFYEDDEEEIPPHPEETQIDLMEVLSRQERMRGKIRLRKTQAKRSRSTKIALHRFADPKTINKRARRLAIKLIKQRMVRGRNLSKLSVGERERIEGALQKRKDLINRVAQRLVVRIRRVEKSRMTKGKTKKGIMPSVF